MTWVCDIPGATAAMSAWHLGLHLGLATFVVAGGIVFLGLAVIAYRRAAGGHVAGTPVARIAQATWAADVSGRTGPDR